MSIDHWAIILLSSLGGAVVTFGLQKYGFSAVVASCIVGLLGALLGHLFQSEHIPLVVFAGSFVGMTSTAWGTFPLMIIGGMVCGMLYGLTLDVFVGYGGRLGTLAFLSTLVAVCFVTVANRFKGSKVEE